MSLAKAGIAPMVKQQAAMMSVGGEIRLLVDLSGPDRGMMNSSQMSEDLELALLGPRQHTRPLIEVKPTFATCGPN
jgi:hypothetical protein